MKLALPKLGLGSPLGFLKRNNSITRVRTPRIEVLFISLENYQSVDVKNGLAWAIWTFTAQVMAKRRARSQTGRLTLTTKSWESTQPRCVRVKCNTLLESSGGGLQVCLRPHPN
jgi:hypothetical protein